MLRRLLALCLTLLAVPGPAPASDEVEYTVVEQDGSFELRQYPAILAAETLVTDTDFDEAGDIAFGRLFRYITGNNRAQARDRHDVTGGPDGGAPGERGREDRDDGAGDPAARGRATPSAATGWPSSCRRSTRWQRCRSHGPDRAHRRDTGPAGGGARLLRLDVRRTAPKKEQALRAELATRRLTVTGEPITAQYDAPFIPGPFRRNEVLIPVSREPDTP